MQRIQMVVLAQLVRASDCGSEGRGFEPRKPPLADISNDEIRMTKKSPAFPGGLASSLSFDSGVFRVPPAPESSVVPLRARLSRRKLWLFRFLMLAGTYLIVETISLCALYVYYTGWEGVRAALDGAAGPDGLESGFDNTGEVVHPFVGFVRRPTAGRAAATDRAGVNQFGFPDSGAVLQERSNNKAIIGILGGSVAEEFSADGVDVLKQELAKSSEFSGKEIVIVRLALSGYKQPQQLMVVNYLLALGAQFDVLINLDGYNEIVLPAVENVPAHVFAGYPRGWQMRVSQAVDLSILRAVGRITSLKDRAKYWAELASLPPLRYSPTLQLAWRVHYAATRRSMFAEFARINARKAETHDYLASGPHQAFDSDADLREHCANIWMRSSLLLHQVCAANGIRYVHFLQPNQYIAGSKPMGGEERFIAVAKGHPGQKPVETGFPVLIREGRNLVSRGVSFTDLTTVFADHPEPIYADHCCHVNHRGNELLAQRIAEVIRNAPDGK